MSDPAWGDLGVHPWELKNKETKEERVGGERKEDHVLSAGRGDSNRGPEMRTFGYVPEITPF